MELESPVAMIMKSSIAKRKKKKRVESGPS
jgi:hypothetical protein